MRDAVQIRPTSGRRVVTIRVRVAATVPAGASVGLADLLLQAGGTASGWVPHVTEMPWIAGVVGGG